MVKQIRRIVLAFDCLEKIHGAEVGALRVGEIAVGVIAVVAFDAVLREQGLDGIDGVHHAGLAGGIVPVALDFRHVAACAMGENRGRGMGGVLDRTAERVALPDHTRRGGDLLRECFRDVLEFVKSLQHAGTGVFERQRPTTSIVGLDGGGVERRVVAGGGGDEFFQGFHQLRDARLALEIGVSEQDGQ